MKAHHVWRGSLSVELLLMNRSLETQSCLHFVSDRLGIGTWHQIYCCYIVKFSLYFCARACQSWESIPSQTQLGLPWWRGKARSTLLTVAWGRYISRCRARSFNLNNCPSPVFWGQETAGDAARLLSSIGSISGWLNASLAGLCL